MALSVPSTLVEHKLLHEEFTALFEDLVEAFLQDHDYNVEGFYRACEAVQKEPELSSAATDVVDMVHAVWDFEDWAKEMIVLAKHRRDFERRYAGAVQARAERCAVEAELAPRR